MVGLEALFEANKKEAQMPFNSWMDITTAVKAYTEVYKQLMRYIFRSKDIEPKKWLVLLRPVAGVMSVRPVCVRRIPHVVR